MTEKLTIFFDGQCPMCCMEMDKLKARDKYGVILLINIHSDAFSYYTEIDKVQAMSVLHGIYRGELLLALDVICRAWQLVGLGMWGAPLQWSIVKPLAHRVYLLVAKYRQPISNFLHHRLGLGQPRCKGDVCHDKKLNINHWRK